MRNIFRQSVIWLCRSNKGFKTMDLFLEYQVRFILCNSTLLFAQQQHIVQTYVYLFVCRMDYSGEAIWGDVGGSPQQSVMRLKAEEKIDSSAETVTATTPINTTTRPCINTSMTKKYRIRFESHCQEKRNVNRTRKCEYWKNGLEVREG